MNRLDGTTAHVRVANAIADLAQLHSTDPAAKHAVHAIKLTRLTLESFWVDEPQPDEPRPDDG